MTPATTAAQRREHRPGPWRDRVDGADWAAITAETSPESPARWYRACPSDTGAPAMLSQRRQREPFR
jgi:hypothetical protein